MDGERRGDRKDKMTFNSTTVTLMAFPDCLDTNIVVLYPTISSAEKPIYYHTIKKYPFPKLQYPQESRPSIQIVIDHQARNVHGNEGRRERQIQARGSNVLRRLRTVVRDISSAGTYSHHDTLAFTFRTVRSFDRKGHSSCFSEGLINSSISFRRTF